MNVEERTNLKLTLKEQFDDEGGLDAVEIEYLFGIIDTLENQVDLLNKIIREGRHVISD